MEQDELVFFSLRMQLYKRIKKLKIMQAEDEWINDTSEIQEHKKSSMKPSIWTLCESLSTKYIFL